MSPRKSASIPSSARPEPPTSRPGTRHSIEIRTGGAITRPLKTAEAVARDVVHDIIEAGLRPGDSLPAEAAMLEQYQVSRESLREGLRLLEVEGLISIRRGPGGGPSVGTVDPANLGRVSTLFYHMAGATYRELFEAWVIAESLLAERAARNPDAGLRRARMEPFISGEPWNDEMLDDYVQTHAHFHSTVGSLAQNRVLELSLATMGLIVSHHVPLAFDPRTLRESMHREHHDIAVAVVGGRASRARSLMHDHIQSVADMTSDAMGPLVEDFIEWH
jgi:GntR family transcriptional regulator, transcriptional repressor for pyruvate dehydrogenase complex